MNNTFNRIKRENSSGRMYSKNQRPVSQNSLSPFVSEMFTLIPYHKIFSLNLIFHETGSRTDYISGAFNSVCAKKIFFNNLIVLILNHLFVYQCMQCQSVGGR